MLPSSVEESHSQRNDWGGVTDAGSNYPALASTSTEFCRAYFGVVLNPSQVLVFSL